MNPLEKTWDYNGREMTAAEICRIKRIPTNIFLWRYGRGNANSLFREVTSPIPFNGEIFTASMLADRYGLEEQLVWRRFRDGIRGENLVAPSIAQEHESKHRRQLERECQRHIQALSKHHYKQRLEELDRVRREQEAFYRGEYDGYLAAAERNAKLFMQAAKAGPVPQNDYMGT